MKFLYNVSVFLYYFIIVIVSPFNQKAKAWRSGRKSWTKKLQKNISSDKIAWFHCASLGEFEQGRPIIESFKKKYPDFKILLTFFSPSGYEIRKNYENADYVCYLPLDTKRNARKFVSIVKPEICFIVKYEYWYHFLNEIHNSSCKLFLVSAIFREDQIFFKSFGKWFKKMLNFYDKIFVQNKESEVLLRQNGINHIQLAGDTRFDRVLEISQNVKRFKKIEEFKNNKRIIICGSTWPQDEIVIAPYINNSHSDTKYILAPHEINLSHINNLRNSIDKKVILWSECKESNNLVSYDVLIIDTIGILSSLYQYGELAYIGGGFGIGIHNTLEAATFSMPVIFGPNYQKFAEAIGLIEHDAAFPINSGKELHFLFNSWETNPAKWKKRGENARLYVQQKEGATTTILETIKFYS